MPASINLTTTIKKYARLRQRLLAISRAPLYALSWLATACGSPLDIPNSSENSATPVEWGATEFALTADLGGVRYALRDAEFSLTGPESLVLKSNDFPDEAVITQEVQSGQYTIELLPGYRLVALQESTEVDVEGTLETPNPQTLLVAADQTTAVSYVFRIAAEPVTFGRGNVAVSLEVEQAEAGGLIFSEFMVNPGAVADTEGEWIEIMNTSASDLDLNGCTIQRDDSDATIEQSLIVPAGGWVALANGAAPGFTPDLQYSGFSLPNTAMFTLALNCGGVTVDSIQVDPGAWPLSAGISAALDPGSATAADNDDGAAWCLANTSFGTDFGSPGEQNDPCSN